MQVDLHMYKQSCFLHFLLSFYVSFCKVIVAAVCLLVYIRLCFSYKYLTFMCLSFYFLWDLDECLEYGHCLNKYNGTLITGKNGA